MSCEGIIAELSGFGVSVQELKYSAPHVFVYRCQYYNAAAAVKVLLWQQGTDYTSLEKECTTMQSLTHPNILKLLSMFWLQQQGWRTLSSSQSGVRRTYSSEPRTLPPSRSGTAGSLLPDDRCACLYASPRTSSPRSQASKHLPNAQQVCQNRRLRVDFLEP